MARAAVSVNMCAASDISARLPVTKPPMTSAIMNAVVRPNATHNERSFPEVGRAWLCSALMGLPSVSPIGRCSGCCLAAFAAELCPCLHVSTALTALRGSQGGATPLTKPRVCCVQGLAAWATDSSVVPSGGRIAPRRGVTTLRGSAITPTVRTMMAAMAMAATMASEKPVQNTHSRFPSKSCKS